MLCPRSKFKVPPGMVGADLTRALLDRLFDHVGSPNRYFSDLTSGIDSLKLGTGLARHLTGGLWRSTVNRATFGAAGKRRAYSPARLAAFTSQFWRAMYRNKIQEFPLLGAVKK